MASPSIDITYAAHTASCTFLLDSEGICRRIVMKPKGKRREASRTASRCVGAQYVASLDGSAAGGLVEMPRVGAAMLFARVDERGRVSLVRTGVVTAFESQAGEDPFIETESRSVETSAPVLSPRTARAAQAAALDDADDDPQDPDYYDPSDRTQRIQALRPEDIAAALGHDMKTSEYHAVPSEEPAPRTTLPGHTLRSPHRDTTIEDDEDDYAHPTLVGAPPFAAAAPPPFVSPPVTAPLPPSPSSRGMLPRRSDPHVRAAARAYAPAVRPTPAAQASDVVISRRRRS